MVRVDVPAGSMAYAHAPQSGRTAHPCVRTLISLSLTDGWTAISTLHVQGHDCFALFEITHAGDVATLARTSLLAARARLDGLVIGMPHTRYR